MLFALERDYRLRWMDFDRYGRLKPQAVLDLFQDVATIHAKEMGFSDEDLLAKGIFWVVTRIKLAFLKQPKRLSCVTVRTWPHTQTKLSFLRDFTITDEAGELIAKATSEWMVISLEKRSFASALLAYDGPKDFDEARTFESKPKKIKNLEKDPDSSVVVTPGFSDFDQNGHLNNAMYARLILDAIELDETHAIESLQIDYRHEVLVGSTLLLESLHEDGAIKVRGLLEDSQIAFMALVETKEA
ncbi:MAG: thioesterase [Eggerthellaceae bacterium]|nr:thioesterase [Eggerthellaceae bacterium]